MKTGTRVFGWTVAGWAAIVIAFAAGCGNGDSDPAIAPATSAAPPTAPASPPPLAPAPSADRYVLGAVLDSSPVATSVPGTAPHLYKVYIIDPATPSAPTEVDDLGTASLVNAGPLASYTSGYTTDRAARSSAYNGAPLMMYVKGGRIWAIDLRVGSSHLPRQVSSIGDLCGGLELVAQMSADGLDAWVKVKPCASGPLYVRSTMGAGDAPLDLGNTTAIDVLDDGAMRALGLLMLDSRGLAFYSTDLVRLRDVSGAAGIRDVPQNGVRDHAAIQSVYYRFGNDLRRLTWTADGAALEPSVYAFTTADNDGLWAGDLDAMYLSEGTTLLKLVSGGSPVVSATLTGARIAALYLTDGHVVIQQSNRDAVAPLVISAMAKAGGTVTPIARAADAAVLGVTPDAVLYTSGTGARLARLDASQDVRVDARAIAYHRRRIADRRDLDSAASCTPSVATDRSCSNGSWTEVPLAVPLPASIPQGVIAHATSYPYGVVTGAGVFDAVRTTTGIPDLLTFYIAADANGQSVNRRDLYVWTPGTPASLARVTQNIP